MSGPKKYVEIGKLPPGLEEAAERRKEAMRAKEAAFRASWGAPPARPARWEDLLICGCDPDEVEPDKDGSCPVCSNTKER